MSFDAPNGVCISDGLSCVGGRSYEWHIHAIATSAGVVVDVENRHWSPANGWPLGWRPRLVPVRDTWWSRVRGKEKSMDERLQAVAEEAVYRVQRYRGFLRTSQEIRDKRASVEAVSKILPPAP